MSEKIVRQIAEGNAHLAESVWQQWLTSVFFGCNNNIMSVRLLALVELCLFSIMASLEVGFVLSHRRAQGKKRTSHCIHCQTHSKRNMVQRDVLWHRCYLLYRWISLALSPCMLANCGDRSRLERGIYFIRNTLP